MTTRQRALAAGLLILLGGLGVWWPTGSAVPVAPATAATAGDVPIV